MAPRSADARALRTLSSTPAFVEIAGQRLTADTFTFEQQTTAAGRFLRISATGVGLLLGGGIVEVKQGMLNIEVSPAGLAGTVSAQVSVSLPSVSDTSILSISGGVTVKINQRGVEAVNRVRELE